MAEKTLDVKIKQRYDTEANWTSADPVLLIGEMAISSDKNGQYKVGNGTSKWSALSYTKADPISHTHTKSQITDFPKVATTATDGFMSAADKQKSDATNIAYGTCSTAAATAEKTVVISGNTNWKLVAGSIISVKFTYTNTGQNPTLNVNETGAKSILYNTAVLTTSSLGYAGYANRYITYVYDGNYYVFTGWSIDNNTTYSNASLGSGYGTCATAAATTAKVVTLSGYSLVTGGMIAIKFTNGNTVANPTLNINSKGAKKLFFKGAALTDTSLIKAGDIWTVVYDGTQYQIIAKGYDNNTTIIYSTSEPTTKTDGMIWLE